MGASKVFSNTQANNFGTCDMSKVRPIQQLSKSRQTYNNFRRAGRHTSRLTPKAWFTTQGTGTRTGDSYRAFRCRGIKPVILVTHNSQYKLASTTTGKRQGSLTAARLSKNWCIPFDSAQQTLKITTQRGVRTTESIETVQDQ